MGVEALASPLLAAGIGYVLGSFPSGYVFVRALAGTDVRTVGSGRTGGTNVFRAAGKAALVLTAIADVGKAFAAVLIARAVFGTRAAEALAGFFAIVGHVWSVFLGFRGGAGVGTAAGAVASLMPQLLLVGAPIFVVVLCVWRYASLASLAAITIAAAGLATLFLQGKAPPETLLFGLASWALIVYAHRGNIERLRAGTERRFGAPH